jgi:hypothetical protein
MNTIIRILSWIWHNIIYTDTSFLYDDQDDSEDEKFDYFKYDRPVKNSAYNVILDILIGITVLLALFALIWVIILIGFTKQHLWLIIGPIIVVFILEKMKDKDAEKEYNDYLQWKNELEDRLGYRVIERR